MVNTKVPQNTPLGEGAESRRIGRDCFKSLLLYSISLISIFIASQDLVHLYLMLCSISLISIFIASQDLVHLYLML